MEFLDLIKQREDFSEKAQGQLEKLIIGLQDALYAAISDKLIAALELDSGGKIKFSTSNIRISANLSSIFNDHRTSTGKVTSWIVKQLVRLFDLNTLYMGEVAKVTDSLEARSRKLLLYNLGYDIDTKKIVSDSWLSNLTSQQEIKQRVANRIATAIQSGVDLKQFRKDFRDDFLNSKTGLGYLERYFNGKTFDLFQQFDRSTNEVYARELKLQWQVYSGTIMKPVKGGTKGTRSFCLQRVNNIYSREEIAKWQEIEFAGRVDPYNPFIDCGSIQCRHSWASISDEMKVMLEKRGRKVDEYNQLPPGRSLKN